MNKNKRSDYRTEFEQVYLRGNQIKKTMESISSKVIGQHLKDPEFIKITQYIGTKVFNKNSRTLKHCGFDQEDFTSLARIYGISFLNSNYGNKTGKDKNYLMLNYIQQRFRVFFLVFERKFNNSIAPPLVFNYTLVENHTASVTTNDTETSYVEMIDQKQETNPNIQDLKHDYSILESKMCLLRLKIKTCSPDQKALKEELIREARFARIKMAHLEAEIKPLQKKLRNERFKEAKISEDLKKKFSENTLKYAEQLCYYSTSNLVPYDIRKKARAICRKNKINFKEWAIKKIQNSTDIDCHFVI